jgi:hypothetical protein
VDAAVELAASQNNCTNQQQQRESKAGRVRKGEGEWSAYEDGAALEGQVDAGAADLAAGAQRRDDHLVSLPAAGLPEAGRFPASEALGAATDAIISPFLCPPSLAHQLTEYFSL